MEFRGRYTLPAPPDMVWEALQDADILAACIPGCEGVSKLSRTEYRAQATLGIGPVHARFTGKVIWTDYAAPDGYTHAATLAGEGQGGAGLARGETQLRVSAGPDAESSVLSYQAAGKVGGRLAQLGPRIVDASAKALADEFFAKFAALIRTGAVGDMDATIPIASPAPPLVPATGERRAQPREEGLRSQVWVVGLIGIVVILLALFSVVL